MFQRLLRVLLPLFVMGALAGPWGPTAFAQQAGTLQFSAATYSVDETAGSATIMVTRTGGDVGAASGMVSTSNGTAQAGTDYTALTAVTGLVSFAAGDSVSKSVSVPILDDGLVGESGETIML